MNSPYNSTRLNMSDEAICPISLNVIKENEKSHPRQTVYIADTKNSISIPYEVETIKKWIDFVKENEGTVFKIPHCNVTLTDAEFTSLSIRVEMHENALIV